MRRRDFIGAAALLSAPFSVSWPTPTRAQQTGRPAQAPTKYHLVLNLRTAWKLNFTFPQTLLAQADEVVE